MTKPQITIGTIIFVLWYKDSKYSISEAQIKHFDGKWHYFHCSKNNGKGAFDHTNMNKWNLDALVFLDKKSAESAKRDYEQIAIDDEIEAELIAEINRKLPDLTAKELREINHFINHHYCP